LDLGRNLPQHLQPFSAHRGLEIGEASEITGWTSQVRDEAAADRIGRTHKHDRNCVDFRLNNGRNYIGAANDQVRPQSNQFRDERPYE